MHIFKYTNHFGKNVIRDQRLKVSEATALNDPFELLPLVDPSIFTIEIVMEVLKKPHMVEESFRRYGKDFPDLEEYRTWHFRPSSLEYIANLLMPNIPKNIESARELFAEQFSSYWRIFCGSLRADSILMWSHYTSNHSGIVLEFDTDDPGFPDIGKDFILPVVYSEARPFFNYFPGVDQFIPTLLSIARTKAAAWSYEEEVRLIVVKSACIEHSFLPFGQSALKRVIFGCRCSRSFQDEILSLLAESGYSHVLVQAARLSGKDYKLHVETIRESLSL